MQVVDRPHLNVAGTLFGYQGPCIDTRCVVNGTGHVYVSEVELVEMVAAAKQAGLLKADESRLAARLADLEAENEQLRARLRHVSEVVGASWAT